MLKPNRQEAIPEETIKVAKAAFPMGNMYLSLRDTLGPIYEDGMFQDLYPSLGQPAESPERLALITVMQYVEDLSDRQAAEAVRSRIDWKYMLGLRLEDPGFDFSVLSEFRQRRKVAVGKVSGALCGAGVLEGTKEATHGFHACAGRCSRFEFIGTNGRGDAPAYSLLASENGRTRPDPVSTGIV